MDALIIVALITSLTSVLTAVFTSIKLFRQNAQIELLKHELDLKKMSEGEIIKFLLTYETDKVNQSFIYLKDFLAVTQRLKDMVKDVLNHYDTYTPEDIYTRLAAGKMTIIDEYSKSIYYFNEIDENEYAHHLKNGFIEIFQLLLTNFNPEEVQAKLLEITNGQKKLQQEVNKNIERLINAMQDRSLSNRKFIK